MRDECQSCTSWPLIHPSSLIPHGIDGLILGGTELPLILRQTVHHGIPLLDTSRIHVSRIVDELVRDPSV
jgi:aspartate/glutamate racemase